MAAIAALGLVIWIGLTLFFSNVKTDCSSGCFGICSVVPTTQPIEEVEFDLSLFLDVLQEVEGGEETLYDDLEDPEIGPLQITRAYWIDSGVGDTYEDMMDTETAREAAVAYFQRYARVALATGDVCTLARIHNGGPRGNEKEATVDYGLRVLNLYKARKANDETD